MHRPLVFRRGSPRRKVSTKPGESLQLASLRQCCRHGSFGRLAGTALTDLAASGPPANSDGPSVWPDPLGPEAAQVGAPRQCQHAGAAPDSTGSPDVHVLAGVPVAGGRHLRAGYM
jgi:hypothetical protein